MPGSVITRGDRELSLRFDTFPERASKRLESRIAALVERLEARIEQVVPTDKGQLRSEITSRTYKGESGRIAGYVSVYAPGAPGEYAKAATLEYGSDKPRKIFSRVSRGKRRIVARLSKPVHIRAYAYLRDPFESLRSQMTDELDAALAEAAQDEST